MFAKLRLANVSYHEFALIEAVLSRGEDRATVCAAVLLQTETLG